MDDRRQQTQSNDINLLGPMSQVT